MVRKRAGVKRAGFDRVLKRFESLQLAEPFRDSGVNLNLLASLEGTSVERLSSGIDEAIKWLKKVYYPSYIKDRERFDRKLGYKTAA